MSKQTRINQQFYNIPGSLSHSQNGIQIQVNFGLIELEDLYRRDPWTKIQLWGPPISRTSRTRPRIAPACRHAIDHHRRRPPVRPLSFYGLRSFTVLNPIQKLSSVSSKAQIQVRNTVAA